jgi:hypothetical protein
VILECYSILFRPEFLEQPCAYPLAARRSGLRSVDDFALLDLAAPGALLGAAALDQLLESLQVVLDATVVRP